MDSKLVSSSYDEPQYSLRAICLASLYDSISYFEKCYHKVSYICTFGEDLSLEQRKERSLVSIT